MSTAYNLQNKAIRLLGKKINDDRLYSLDPRLHGMTFQRPLTSSSSSSSSTILV